MRIYILYHVNPKSGSPGDTTAWSQQQTLLLQQDKTKDPRKRVIDDLLQELTDAIDSRPVQYIGEKTSELLHASYTQSRL